MVEIIFKDKNSIIAYKPAGMSSQSDPTSVTSLFDEVKAELRGGGEDDELYLIHRLDKVVGGLLCFARNKSSAQRLSEIVSDGVLCKEYLAVVDGVVDSSVFCDYLRKNTTLSKAEVTKEGAKDSKYAELSFDTLSVVDTLKGKKALVKILLKTGRFHQIRAQFSSRGTPLSGDKKYGSKDLRARHPALFAYRLEYNIGENVSATRLPDTTVYPWNLFEKSIYKELDI